jgi:uncharacterized lipoprotein YmbA
MKPSLYLPLLGLMCGAGLLLSGCLIKPARVPTRHFVLAPIPAPERAPAAAQPLSVEVGSVKMPSYLLREAMVVRKSANEFEYLEDALWAERLDRCFQRTLSNNLSSLLASDQVHEVRVSVEVEQLDVDTQGRGTLLAWWRLTLPGSEKSVKSGLTRLTRPGPTPLGNPQVIATTLSALTAQFSQELADVIGSSTPAKGR